MNDDIIELKNALIIPRKKMSVADITGARGSIPKTGICIRVIVDLVRKVASPEAS